MGDRRDLSRIAAKEVSAENVIRAEELLERNLNLRTEETDTLFKKYLDFVTLEMGSIEAEMDFPTQLMGRDVSNWAQVREVFTETMNRVLQELPAARGRGQNDALGAHFWTSSTVPDLQKAFHSAGAAIDQVYTRGHELCRFFGRLIEQDVLSLEVRRVEKPDRFYSLLRVYVTIPAGHCWTNFWATTRNEDR